MSVLSAATFAASPVSRYSHTNARMEVTGSEASSAPTSELRRATSDTAAISSAERRTLRPNCITAAPSSEHRRKRPPAHRRHRAAARA
jgi:hypothetical protein